MLNRAYRGRRVRRSSLVVPAAAVAVLLVVVLALGSTGAWLLFHSAPADGADSVPGGDAQQTSGQGPEDGNSPDLVPPEVGGEGAGSSAEEEPGPGEEAPPETAAYDFSQPAPETAAVDNSYFEDAAFVGDSRTDGFLIYSGIGCGENLTSNGLSIFKLAEKKALTINGQDYTLLEALGLKQYGKVYLSLGVNELGYYDDQGFYEHYLEAIDAIREAQPNAVIYIQGLIPLNEQRIAETTKRSYLTNDHLRIYNDLMFQAAREKQVVFLDLYSAFVDENGSLPYDASHDGVHLGADYCRQWLAYLQTHTVDPALLEAGRALAQTQPDQGQA